MAINWEYNNKEYVARLRVFYYLCNNWWRFLQEYKGKPVISFIDIPSDILGDLSILQYKCIKNTIDNFWELRHHKHSYTIDDILQDLGWAFNYHDLKDFKLVYNEPKKPKGRRF